MTAARHGTADQVRWMLDRCLAEDLILLFGTLDDYLHHADAVTVAEITDYLPARPWDSSLWTDWAAETLGEAVLALQLALTTPNQTGESR